MASRNRGKKKLTLRSLAAERPTDDEASEILNSLLSVKEPTAVAIIGASIVEHELDTLIQPRLPRKDDATWDELTEDNGPLRSFYTKIQIGYAFRIYDHAMRTNLNVVRSIRNAFAHSRKRITFRHELVIAELQKLRFPQKSSKPFKQIITSAKNAWKTDGLPNYGFILLCLALSMEFSRVHARTLAARSRRWKRKEKAHGAKRLLFSWALDALAEEYLSDPNRPSNFVKWFQDHQSAGPMTEALRSSRPTPRRKAIPPVDNEGM